MVIEQLKQEALLHGDQCRIVPIGRLKDLRRDIEDFRDSADLNRFQRYITSRMYHFDLPPGSFDPRSVLIIASPVPSYAKLIFNWGDRRIPVVSPARSYEGKPDAETATQEYLYDFLSPLGYHIERAPQLPLKRLAVRSGLAVYGRSNICFVEGMGSFLTLAAYLSDIEPAEDGWHDIRQMDRCSHCTACLDHCPTGAIVKDRFLIDNERCLSFFNENEGAFPEWLPNSAHYCVYDCLRCQEICPANKEAVKNVIGPIEFDEMETDLLLSSTPMDGFPAGLKQKVKFLGMDKWIEAIPRNLKILLENGAAK